MWLNRMWHRYGGYCIPGAVVLLFSLFGYISWFIRYIASLPNAPTVQQPIVISPIDLGAVTATLGGLVLVGAFYKEHAAPREGEHNDDLKTVGKSLLVASTCFIVGYFLIEYVRLIDSEVLSAAEL